MIQKVKKEEFPHDKGGIKLGTMPGLLEEFSYWDYVMAYGVEFSAGGLANSFYFGPTKKHQATIFSKKVVLLADNAVNASLKDIDAILALKIYFPTTEEARVVLC